MNYLFALLIVLVLVACCMAQWRYRSWNSPSNSYPYNWNSQQGTGRHRRILKWICFNFLLFDSDYILYLQENFFNASLLSVVISQVF
ncbi:UNVERIFIED_CONTAM: hypothetical protein NCL1_26271 [Trichonephila clavipes]